MLNKVFRYKVSSICFITSILVMLFALLGGVSLINSAKRADDDKIWSEYEESLVVTLKTGMLDVTLMDIIKDEANIGNMTINSIGTAIVGDSSGYSSVEIIIKDNEELRYYISQGELPNRDKYEYPRQIALGYNRLKNSYERDGKRYITINNEEYLVTGIIGDDERFYWKNMLVSRIECLGDGLKKEVFSGYNFEFNWRTSVSSRQELKAAYDQLYLNIKEKHENVLLNGKYISHNNESTVGKTLGEGTFNLNGIVYIFCIINCFITSELWFMARKRELAIRKAFGYSVARIIGVMLKDIIEIIAISIMIFGFIYCLSQWIFGMALGIVLTFNWLTFVSIVITIALIAIASLIFPLVKVMRMNLAEGVRM